jgi:hypothetical protein
MTDMKELRALVKQLADDEKKITTRDQYLDWTMHWKAAYKQITLAIREFRKNRKEYIWKRNRGPEHGCMGPDGKWTQISKKRVKVGPNPNYDSSANYWSRQASFLATSMLELRAQAKAAAKLRSEKKVAA